MIILNELLSKIDNLELVLKDKETKKNIIDRIINIKKGTNKE